MNVAKGDSIQSEKLEVDDSVCLPSSSTAKISKKDIITKANVKDGKCSITMEVDTPLVPFVKGKGGSVQKQIEEELQVELIFPSSKEETSLVVIEGNKVENLTKASERIKQVLEEAVQSRMVDYSHFISLPLAENSDLVQKLLQFQSTILGEIAEGDSGLGIDKSIFIKPKTFHLTVLMLKLWNKDRIATASDILQRISSKVMEALENKPIFIQLKGLTCMKGSPAKARVLYAPVFEVGEEGRLVRACQLHATLMNVRHRKSVVWRSTRKTWNDSFDAQCIFDEYGSEEWGEYPISEIHLSQRSKYDESGYYHCCSSITLPAKMPTI